MSYPAVYINAVSIGIATGASVNTFTSIDLCPCAAAICTENLIKHYISGQLCAYLAAIDLDTISCCITAIRQFSSFCRDYINI